MKKNIIGKSVLTTAIASSMSLVALAGCSTGTATTTTAGGETSGSAAGNT